MAQVLVIGSGGREHALAWKLAQSDKVDKIIVAPGNAGVHLKHSKVRRVDASDKFPGLASFDSLSRWCKERVDFVVVGPEDPLANGIIDNFRTHGVPCFGPNQKAAAIEASKLAAKSFMSEYAIPTACWDSFTNPQFAKEYILSQSLRQCVVKASGLAAGKGVVVARSEKEAFKAVDDIMTERKYGSSCGDTVIVEELLEGFEVSCLCFTDGHIVKCMPLSQDHKRLLDGDKGPNTGGMGAYAPCPLVDEETQEEIHYIMEKTVLSLKLSGTPFTGVLYGGFMVTSEGPKVLEFNCRFGDPETQVLLPLLKSDLYDVMRSCYDGTLGTQEVLFETQKSAVAVVAASGGYPEKYQKGFPIHGLDTLPSDIVVFHAGTARNDSNDLVTSGGRVLAIVAVEDSLQKAATRALEAVACVRFDSIVYRKDIAHAAFKSEVMEGLTYADSGVSVAAGYDLVSTIKPLCRDTEIPGCVGGLGMFGSVFDLKQTEFKDPLLISSTDGVGTKLLVALECKSHVSIGQDLVAMCVNDILCHGARPLYFLDYYATGKLNTSVAAEVIGGIARACQEAGCALVGGETAEMPDMYAADKYDLAGFAVGAVERSMYLPRLSEIQPGDVVIGIASSGLHSNGYSMVRRIVNGSKYNYSDQCPFDETLTLGEALLIPTRIYVKQMSKVIASGKVKAVSHITGGGLLENMPRVLPAEVKVDMDARKWTVAPVFGWLQSMGRITDSEMTKTFNCGLGLVLIADKANAESVCADTGGQVVGTILSRQTGEPQIRIGHLHEALHGKPATQITQKRVGVLISGSGTNLQALIDSCQAPSSSAKIVLVVSNKDAVKGLERAKNAGIPTKVISHSGYARREDFDSLITVALEAAEAHIVCLAGFMRILSGKFVNRWEGRLINVHPSLLPSFKGMDAHQQALAAGVKVSGCTVHVVKEEIDSGEILEQEAVPVLPGDTVETLQDRVKAAEHKAFPRALQNLASQFTREEQ